MTTYVLSLMTMNDDHTGVVAYWHVSPRVADILREEFGQPHAEQLFDAGHVAAARQVARDMPTIHHSA